MFKKLFIIFVLTILWVMPAQATEESSRFITITDIHFNPFVTCQIGHACPVISYLMAAPAEQWTRILQEYDKTQPHYQEETGLALLQSSLRAAQKIAKQQSAKFILVLGDSLAHRYKDRFAAWGNSSPAEYQSFVKKTYEFLNLEFQQAFPNLDIYNVVGNNDSYVDDYVSIANGPFYKEIGMLWASAVKEPLARATIETEFPTAGYYGFTLPSQKNLHLIVLNSVIFTPSVTGTNLDVAAQQELKWLQLELATTHHLGQKAIIALHIPVGIDAFSTVQSQPFKIVELWQPTYAKTFLGILNDYTDDIAVVLPGHFHMDALQTATFAQSKFPIINTPGISPIYGNNPGFKLLSLSSAGVLQNYVTYFDNLTGDETWAEEYNFNKTYQPNCVNCNVADGIDSIKKIGSLAELYKFFFAVSTYNQPITTKYLPYYWCAMHHFTAESYQACLRMQF